MKLINKVKFAIIGSMLFSGIAAAGNDTIDVTCTVTEVSPHYHVMVRYHLNKDNPQYSPTTSKIHDGSLVKYSCLAVEFETITTKKYSAGDEFEALFIVLPR